MTSTRRPATPADLVVGAVVYKGNGSTPWQVVQVEPSGVSAGLVKVGSAPRRGNAAYHHSELTVQEDQ